MLDEQALRRPGFEEGTAVTLADGQDWQLARPRVRLCPAANDQGWKTVLTRPDGGVFAGLMDAYDNLSEEATVGEVARLELGLGKALLTANYELDDEQVGSLIQFAYNAKDDPEGTACREAVMGVIFGYGAPKPSAVGDDSPSSSTA